MYKWRYNLTETGLYVVSSKYCEDLKNRDRILTVNGQAVSTEAEYEAAVAGLKAGDTLTLTYRRGSSEEKTVSFEIRQYVPTDVATGTSVQFTD